MDERLNRYDFEGKNNRFMEFISREMMRNKHHQSHLNHPKNNVTPSISRVEPTSPRIRPPLSILPAFTPSPNSTNNAEGPACSKVPQRVVIQMKAHQS